MGGEFDVIFKDLLEILVCPESHQTLTPADAATIARLERRRAEGTLKNRAGKPVADPIQHALIREDRRIAYPIVDSIPIMLIDEGIPLDQLDS
ncbi:MAG: hypothetical protein BWZ08_00424 [candidate division BRC1 bacterium ADurb.BinA292]|nr:MAG: hypothetical protein BWZ08_00424 [candidate division BRC1 bacterium ADurb.BinA292]